MNHPVEKMLFIVSIAGVLAAVLIMTVPVRTTQRSEPPPTSVPPPAGGQEPGAASPDWVKPPDSVSTDAGTDGQDQGGAAAHDHSHETGAYHSHGAEPVDLTATTLRYPPDRDAEAPDPSGPPLEEAGQCPPIEDLWIADGYAVEDPCTLAEVRRSVHLAYTGTDEQRRGAIRNGPLLDEVFGALDDFGRTHDAALYHPEQRGRSGVIFEEIVWRGGPDADRGVIAVRYRLDHPDFPPTDPVLDTLVQVDGEWKVSYRRSYCVKVLVIMEHVGSDVRCPRDPNPDVNEDEAPGSTGRY